MDKVSVVLPIYNVEDYLERCVRSVLAQTYTNLEVILVDDGAKDSSGQICDRLAKEDNRIVVVHKENGGLSSARNVGYDIATGKYLMYIDSDDCVKKDVVKKCVDTIEEEDSDIVIYGYEKVTEEGNILEVCKWTEKTYSHDEMEKHLYDAISEMSFGYAWNKLYKKSVIDESGIRADSKIIDREDLIFNMELLKYVKKISYIEYVGYEYLQRATSLLHNSNLARLKGIEYFVERMHGIDIEDAEVKKRVFNMNVLHYLSDCIIKNVIWNKDLLTKEKKLMMRDIFKNVKHKNELYECADDSRYLKLLYKSLSTGKLSYFYIYVKLSDLKNKIKRNI